MRTGSEGSHITMGVEEATKKRHPTHQVRVLRRRMTDGWESLWYLMIRSFSTSMEWSR